MKNRRRLTGAAALSLTALATTMGAQPAAAQDVAVIGGDLVVTDQFDVFNKANPAFLKINSPAFDKANPAFLKINSPAFDKANPAFLKISPGPGD